MVQILPERPDFLSSFLGSATQSLPQLVDAFKEYGTKMKEANKIKKENQALEKFGLGEYKGAPDWMKQLLVKDAQEKQSLNNFFGNEPSSKNVSPAVEGEEIVETPKGDLIEQYEAWEPKKRVSFAQKHPKQNAEIQRIRKERQPTKLTAREQPISPEQLEIIQQVRNEPGFNDLDEVEQYRRYIDAGVSPINAKSEAEVIGKQRERKENKFVKERQFAIGQNKKFVDEIENLRTTLPEREGFLNSMEQSILQGNIGALTLPALAEYTGIKAFETPESSAFKTASKEFFLGDIRRAGARPNQWIEQQIQSAYPQVGKTKAANFASWLLLKFKEDLDKAKVETFDQAEENDLKKEGYLPANFSKQVYKDFLPKAQILQDKLAYQLRDLYDREKGISQLKKELNQKVIPGTPLTLLTAKLMYDKYGDKAEEHARKLGYTIPTEEQLEAFKNGP